ncbi:MAG TPA: hypothetical protein VF844_12910 [Ktedonobacteraceae bacterium]
MYEDGVCWLRNLEEDQLKGIVFSEGVFPSVKSKIVRKQFLFSNRNRRNKKRKLMK